MLNACADKNSQSCTFADIIKVEIGRSASKPSPSRSIIKVYLLVNFLFRKSYCLTYFRRSMNTRYIFFLSNIKRYFKLATRSKRTQLLKYEVKHCTIEHEKLNVNMSKWPKTKHDAVQSTSVEICMSVTCLFQQFQRSEVWDNFSFFSFLNLDVR